MQLLFATSNINKVKEIQSLLPEGFSLLGLNDIGYNGDIPETADTIEGNSLLKAQFIAENFNRICFSEDTGLEVVALNGRPGVRTARYAGEQACNQDNISLVLKEMNAITERKARFKTVISFFDGNEFQQFEGICNGHIATDTKGNDGFGYDPIFIPDGELRTFAEMTLAEKNKFSHRKKAFNQFLEYLKDNK
ncbi:MAG: RdgB/HAM1 family non-canonical purine NTP pyrophosphatase [Chitinophagales bacterium]|jgi:XTP/dITP diphosphohydrolase|nr:RdgB/HAM1 family non-canonical purine NTP pyrophosphatase [Chitinophagales bacterium]